VIKPNKNQLNISDYKNIVIVGGGMVGMATALALSRYKLNITLIETIPVIGESHPSYDDRTLVVNRASIRFWTNLRIWQNICDDITPIKKVHVSNKGYFGSVVFDASEYGLEALAYIVEAKVLGINLKQEIEKIDNINIKCPAQVVKIKHKKDDVEVSYKQDDIVHSIKCHLLLAADGAQSEIRSSLELETKIKPYNRKAIICNITPENKHNNCAYERLTNTGPTAILPFVNNRCGFVWTVPENIANEILNLTDEEFLKEAQNQFGYRLGKFIKVGKRSSYPLYLVTVPKQVKSRTILLGNAAHSMSPVSAQGLNLAIRDIANLTDIIAETLEKGQDIGSDDVLSSYQNTVNDDQNQTIKYTDDLMSWFKINNPIVNSFRSLGLLTLNQLSHLKLELFTRASGFRGKTATLLRRK